MAGTKNRKPGGLSGKAHLAERDGYFASPKPLLIENDSQKNAGREGDKRFDFERLKRIFAAVSFSFMRGLLSVLALLLLAAVSVEALHGMSIGKDEDQPHVLAPTLDSAGVTAGDEGGWLPQPVYLDLEPLPLISDFIGRAELRAPTPPDPGGRRFIQKLRLHRRLSVELI